MCIYVFGLGVVVLSFAPLGIVLVVLSDSFGYVVERNHCCKLFYMNIKNITSLARPGADRQDSSVV